MKGLVAIAALALVACGAIARESPEPPSTGSTRCGQGYVWTPPAGNPARAVVGENRDLETIATQLRLSALVVAAHNVCVEEGDAFPRSIDPLLRGTRRHAALSERCGLTKDDVMDGWGRPMFYGVIGDSLVVSSAGRDGMYGTSDDIGPPPNAGAQSRPFTAPDSSFCRTR